MKIEGCSLCARDRGHSGKVGMSGVVFDGISAHPGGKKGQAETCPAESVMLRFCQI